MPDGSFPINSVEDLKNAIHACGRAKDIEAAKRHIKKRAKDLNRENLIPDAWKDKKTISLGEIDETIEFIEEARILYG